MNTSPADSFKLPPEKLYRHCSLDNLSFITTADLEPLDQLMIGQDRALAAADFGIKMEKEGYNIYALGSEETDKRNLMEMLIKKEAGQREVPPDVCYVCNLKDENKPIALVLPPGKSVTLQYMMKNLCDELPNILNSTFESDEYHNRREKIEEQLKDEDKEQFAELQEKVSKEGLTIITSPFGYTFAPIKNDKVMEKEEIQNLGKQERQRLENKMEKFQNELQKILRKLPERHRKYQSMREELNREFAELSINNMLEEIEDEFKDQPKVIDYLDQIRGDIISNVEEIIHPGGSNPLSQLTGNEDIIKKPSEHPVLWRYLVNILVNNKEQAGAPVIYEDNPTYNNLIGRIEHFSELGTLTTDYTYIKAGGLLKANGGYLLLDALQILTKPFAWEGLKRVLKCNELKIESPADMYGLYNTISLEPEPVEINVKVILIGSRMLYYLLCAYDSDFKMLFKVDVDFEEEIDWNINNQELYAHLIAGIAKKYELKPLNKPAVCRIIEHASRLVDDNEKITTHIRDIVDLLREADYWTREQNTEIISREAVEKAIDQKKYRSSRMRDKYQEEIIRNSIYIETGGDKIGQINGLSIVNLGNSTFGHPTRITARVQAGEGKIINIEREVEMSGPIHSKGVLILSAFLGARYASEKPLSLSASLVFEQSYGGVEGDSASSTELYALLSAIGDIPVKQSIAVTGSVDQHGQIQPIGGINEKVEGFFDICEKRGLNGEQGVLIPNANVKNLMLKEEVIDAVVDNNFAIYAIGSIDEGMELLADLPMGERNRKGHFPRGSVNYKVENKLNHFATIRQDFVQSPKHNGSVKK